MNKFIKISFVFILMVACSCFGFNLTNLHNQYADATQVVVVPDILTTDESLIPTTFDLRDEIYIEVEHQYDFSICYAYASLTSLETYLALNYGEYYDFSELHFSTSMYFQNGYYTSVEETINNGGNFSHFTLYTQKTKSLVLEQAMPMSKYEPLSSSQRVNKLTEDFAIANENFYPIVKVNDTVSYEQFVGNKSLYNTNDLAEFRKQVKQHLMSNGSLTAGIYTSTSFNYKTINYKVTDENLVRDEQAITQNTNHLISIIGWDDNYDAGGLWTNPGAYICLNSWGTTFGNNGYFYVSYDDYFIESSIQGVVDATLSTTHNKISIIDNYQENTSIVTHRFTSPTQIYTANVIDITNYIGEKITYIDSFIKGNSISFYAKLLTPTQNINTYLTNPNALSKLETTEVEELTLSTRYSLTTPLEITDKYKYLIIMREIKEPNKIHSLINNFYKFGNTQTFDIEPTYYYQSYELNPFNDIWAPNISTSSGTLEKNKVDCTIPIILHTDASYVQVQPFESNIKSVVGETYIKNNAIFVNKTAKLTLNNADLSKIDLNSITVKKLVNNLADTDISNNFVFSIVDNALSIKMVTDVAVKDMGDYLIEIPYQGYSIYRVVEIQDVAVYNITYHLNGGTANNPDAYTNKITTLELNNPTKQGYQFTGWYLDADLTQEFDASNLPYMDLELYAKYDFAAPTVTKKSSDISQTYKNDTYVDISVEAYHALANEYNTLAYQWFKSDTADGTFTAITGANSPTLSLINVADSGYYACKATITITDPSLGNTTYQKTSDITADNIILVNIKPYIYDTSKIVWAYSEAFAFNNTSHTVELANLPEGMSATYTNNQFTDIGVYTAHAELTYDSMDGNAIAEDIEDLVWEIRKAKIKITIHDINTQDAFSPEELESKFSCTIDYEYLPGDLTTQQLKIAYLELTYSTQATESPYETIITATTKTFDIYDIEIIDGAYRIVIYTLISNNITAFNRTGFLHDCTFEAIANEATPEIKDLLRTYYLDLVSSYTFRFSHHNGEEVEIYVPLTSLPVSNGLIVYMFKDGKLTNLSSSTTDHNLNILTYDKDAVYLIVRHSVKEKTNDELMVALILISIYYALCVYSILHSIRTKHNF